MSMSMLHFFLNALLYAGSGRLRPYERACVDAFRGLLSSGAAAILDCQLVRFDLIQRTPGGRLVALYERKAERYASWRSEDLFPLRSEERVVARVWLRPTADINAPEIKADIVLRAGRLSSIEFTKNPKPLKRGSEVVKVRALTDVMRTEPPLEPASLGELPDDVRKLLRNWAPSGLHRPLSPLQRQELIESIDAKLPDEYMQLVAATEGVTISDWQIYGLSQIRKIVQPDANYYLLAEASDYGAIGVAQGSEDSGLYFIDNEGDQPKPVGRSLLAFLDQHIARR